MNNLTDSREEFPQVRGTPKVQIWNRRTQMKLSGKRTLFPTKLWKIVQ
jgi:hypothetical protein